MRVLLPLMALAGAALLSPPASPTPTPRPATYMEDTDFLEKHGKLYVLTTSSGGKVAASAQYQGRVMTSAVDLGGRSLGWINRAFIESGRSGTAFDNYGGEDRFWLGPEGGQYALFFAPGKPFVFANWRTPAALQEGTWEVKESSADRVIFTRTMALSNYAGRKFTVEVERKVRVMPDAAVAARLGVDLDAAREALTKWVAFETVNRITNRGTEPWTAEKGLLSIWILAMYAPSKDAHVVIPFDRNASGPVVNDAYFGKVPASRLETRPDEGYLVFKCDGELRSKIGVGPARARDVLGSYSASDRLLTIVNFDKRAGRSDYVNSMWEKQAEPYGGDVVNSYNDGPVGPGQPSLGGFYELETSSPAAALEPGASLVHAHRTFHFVGERAALDVIAGKVLGVTASRIAEGIR
jgi:Family of unknown function (DUF6786)